MNRLFLNEPRLEQQSRTFDEFRQIQNQSKRALWAELNAPKISEPKSAPQKTGWLRGSLSYPWIFIALGIADLMSEHLSF